MKRVNNNDYLSESTKLLLLYNEIRKGMPRKTIIDRFVEEWGVCETNLNFMYQQALDFYKDPERVAAMRDINITRLEELYHDAHDQKDTKNAIRAIDVLNKTCNLYTQQIEVKTGDEAIEFKINTI